MSELKIDEKNIKGLCVGVTALMKDMLEDMNLLENKNADLFERYMALLRLGAFFSGAKSMSHMAMHTFRMGFDLHHPFLQTPEAIKRGWNEIKLDQNPLFEQEQNQGFKLEMHELPNHIKEAIIEILKQRGAKPDVH